MAAISDSASDGLVPRVWPAAWHCRGAGYCLVLCVFSVLVALCSAPSAFPQTQAPAPTVKPPVRVQRPKPPVSEQPKPPENPAPAAEDDESGEAVLPGDWGPELLYGIISSKNEDARDALYDAAFAAGPSIIPQLEAALKDDRTAEFAAQSLAYIGGPKALQILGGLVKDPRDLDLRRFYYSALGEFQAPEASNALLYAINRADAEPDRTVTQAAIVALTVHSDASLIPALRQAEAKIQDVVLHDDLDNAIQVIQDRARYLASPAGKSFDGSLEQAVRAYFMPALEEDATDSAAPSPAPKSAANKSSQADREGQSNRADEAKPGDHPAASKQTDRTATDQHHHAAESRPPVKVNIRNLTFSPSKRRALARVSFEDPSAVAYYDIVLQKRGGDWVVASVWLGSEVEKPTPAPSTEQPANTANPANP